MKTVDGVRRYPGMAAHIGNGVKSAENVSHAVDGEQGFSHYSKKRKEAPKKGREN